MEEDIVKRKSVLKTTDAPLSAYFGPLTKSYLGCWEAPLPQNFIIARG